MFTIETYDSLWYRTVRGHTNNNSFNLVANFDIMESSDLMKNDKQYFVEIATTQNGEALVKVAVAADTPLVVDASFGSYTQTIEVLKDNSIAVAERKYKIK